MLHAAGLAAVPSPHLPARFAVVPTHAAGLARLAGDNAAAWMYPATADVLAPHAMVCPGLLRPEGIVAEYATVGDGWDGPGAGASRLGYYLQTPSGDLAAALQASEISRAMEQWSGAAALEWYPAAGPAAQRSVTFVWGAG